MSTCAGAASCLLEAVRNSIHSVSTSVAAMSLRVYERSSQFSHMQTVHFSALKVRRLQQKQTVRNQNSHVGKGDARRRHCRVELVDLGFAFTGLFLLACTCTNCHAFLFQFTQFVHYAIVAYLLDTDRQWLGTDSVRLYPTSCCWTVNLGLHYMS